MAAEKPRVKGGMYNYSTVIGLYSRGGKFKTNTILLNNNTHITTYTRMSTRLFFTYKLFIFLLKHTIVMVYVYSCVLALVSTNILVNMSYLSHSFNLKPLVK